ncbi:MULTISPECIES: universal stress protein [Microbacterium]|uniref:universal stress protein n=1 Tax=Microbacterium TaxID=33882 RepID=UPI001E353544|nr:MULTISPECIES: universal stress protein [Microbacterium]MCC9053226.1 universal stress protein [Microbacterium sp. F2E]
MNDTITVGVTGAPAADRAVDWALARAAARSQRLELVGVVGGALGTVGEDAVVDDALAATRAMLDAHAERIRAEAPSVPVSVRAEAGNPVHVLIEASTRSALLVIGSDYRGPGDGPARGAHGVRIAAGAACPVVVVPDFDTSGRSGVVVGIDGSDASEHALRFAAAEADRLGEPLVAVSVWTPLTAPRNTLAVYPELYLTNMQAATEETLALALAGIATDYPDLVVERRAERGYPSQVIGDIAHDARLAVVGTHGRGALARFLLGSISQEILGRLPTVTAVVR